MQLTEHNPGDHYFIRSVHDRSVVINDQTYDHSLILGARLLEPHWPVTALDALSKETVAPLLAHRPEVVIVGVGHQQAFPRPDIVGLFLTQQVGFECMTLQAACRTFNVLMSENRRAVLGLILPQIDK